MGLFGGSSKSRTTTTNSSTIITNTSDNRQDNRQFIDNSFTRIDNTRVDARQDNRQFIDSRQTHHTDARSYIDESVTVGAGGINAAGAVTINEIDGGAVADAFDFAETVAANSITSVKELVDEVLSQTDTAFEEQNQRNLMIVAGIGLAAVVGMSFFGRKAA